MQSVIAHPELASRESARTGILQEFETQLNPVTPEAGTMAAKVIACGEVSAVLTLADLPGVVCKRMSGFETAEQVTSYICLVRQYYEILESLGVGVVPTELAWVRSAVSGFVVYLLQPELVKAELGNQILRTGSDEQLFFVLSQFLQNTEKIFSFNRSNPDNLCIAADSQISNWHVAKEGIRLLDVGTPCLRKGSRDFFDSTVIGKAMPGPLRFVFNRAGLMRSYFDAYFSPRKIIIDHVANYIKEGRPDRIPSVLNFIDQWISKNGKHLVLEEKITMKEINAFYLKDVLLLELFLQSRRLDRFLKTRLFGKPYDYILPENISRFSRQ